MTSSYDQQQLEQNAIFEIEKWIGVISVDMPWPVFSDKTRALCDNFLTLATTSLYKNLKIEMFQHNLCRAAANWCQLMDAIKLDFPENVPSLHYSTPIYAAIIAGDIQLLHRVKSLMSTHWQEKEECQIQFHVTWLILLLSINGATMDEEIESHLVALKACDVSPGYYPLLDILLQKEPNKGEFWEEFESLHIQHEITTEKKSLSSIISLRENAAKRFLWFEGICLLRLAKIREIEFPAVDILYCPEEACELRDFYYPGDWLMLS